MSLRVAGKIAPDFVVTFAKGMTLDCMFRLVWHDFAKQRGSRMKYQQTLTRVVVLTHVHVALIHSDHTVILPRPIIALLAGKSQTLVDWLCQILASLGWAFATAAQKHSTTSSCSLSIT
jgi:hypothetical protein